MADHPDAVNRQHPLVIRVREICMTFPEAAEVWAWGNPTFRAGKKIFALVSRPRSESLALVFKPDAEERRAYLERAEFLIPPYWGPGGWLALQLEGDVDWDELAEIIDSSYREIALVRQIKQLDARQSSGAEPPSPLV